MATVTVGPGSQRVTLDARTVVGRSSACALRVHDARVSAEHVAVYWHDGAWYVRDLGSTNGTWIGAERLAPGEKRRIARDAEVFLGAADGVRVRLVDDASPGARAVDVATGAVRIAAGELLHLPDDESPELTVLHDDGWQAERDGAMSELADQQLVEVAGVTWRLELPARTRDDGVATTETPSDASLHLESCGLRFRVSADEEHVELRVHGAKTEVEVATRGFHYMLLTLARLRLGDADRGVAPAEQGWVYADELGRMLGVSRAQLNLDVCRARQSFAGAGIAGAARLVERRRGSNKLRIGVPQLEVRAFG